tara:strand:- start:4 stop:501 length:498 start_codon:yes stop_codon:yes gene_type:complete
MDRSRRSIIHKELSEETVNKFLETLEYFKLLRPDLNMATTGDVCSINAYHTGNIFKFKTCLELKKEIEPVIPYEEKLDLFHIHLLHFFNKGFEKPHDHQKTEDYSFIAYLQDSEDGNTCFQMDDEVIKIKPEKGKIVFFPSSIWHWGEPSSGNKKLAVGALKIVA